MITDLIEAIRQTGKIRQPNITVEDREITITGQSSSYYGKQMATHAVIMKLAEKDQEFRIFNEIEVDNGRIHDIIEAESKQKR